MRGFLIVLFSAGLFSTIPFAGAQELVVNGGLESIGKCPDGPVTKKLKVDGRVKAAQGNPDLYSACSSTFGVPENWSDHQGAWEGEAYAGLVLTSDMPNECGSREYLQFPLTQPLENGRRYRITFHVSPAGNSGYFTDRVGATFSTEDLSRKGVTGGLRERAHMENPLGRFINDTTGWLTVSGVYNALGGERYVLIGNFHPCNSSSRVRVDPDKLASAKRKTAHRLDPIPRRGSWQEWMGRTAYAFVDGVSLVPDNTSPDRIIPLTADLACPPDVPEAAGPELIPDPSFEHNVHPKPNSWRNASDGTPDLFNGNTGLYLFSAAYGDNREYIRTPLADTLDPCTTYRIGFDVWRNTGYAYATDMIGVVVTDTFHTRRDRMQMDFPWAWHSPPGLLLDTHQPMTLCGTFRPMVCATQLLLGNFAPDSLSTLVRIGDETDGPFAYYFVDNVHLHAIAREQGCEDPCPATVDGAERAETTDTGSEASWPESITLRFDTDSDQPLNAVSDSLDRLVELMASDATVYVRITGHTDDSGTRAHNQRLAQNRAGRLRRALIERGVDEDRITALSAGSLDPIADNGTPEGRALNRRVVVELVGH